MSVKKSRELNNFLDFLYDFVHNNEVTEVRMALVVQ